MGKTRERSSPHPLQFLGQSWISPNQPKKSSASSFELWDVVPTRSRRARADPRTALGRSMETRKRSPQKAMDPAGQTKATQQGKAAQADKIEAFLEDMAESNPELSQIWGAAFEKVPVAVLASTEFWGHFATWLVEIYVISEGDVNGGQHLGVGPAHHAWSGAIDSARKTVAKLKAADAKEHQVHAWRALCPRPRRLAVAPRTSC